MPHPRLIKTTFASGRRIIIISDIHAHLAHLNALLEKTNFCADDQLILLGDIIESGPRSLDTLRRAMELADAGNAIALAGNWDYSIHAGIASDDPEMHEMLRRRTLGQKREYGSSLVCDMCDGLGIDFHVESPMQPILERLRAAYPAELKFLADMPLILDAGDFVCVHGGITGLDDESIYSPDDYSFLKNDAFAKRGHAFPRWVIAGHWPVSNYDAGIPVYSPHIFPESRIVAIDGGCGKQAAEQLNALILRAGAPGEFSWDFVDDFPRARALEPQESSSASIHTSWESRYIDILEPMGDITRVRHHASGRVLEVPSERLFVSASSGGATVLGDYTDYMLPVSPGDELSILIETSRGLYCKKGATGGWYAGKYEKIP